MTSTHLFIPIAPRASSVKDVVAKTIQATKQNDPMQPAARVFLGSLIDLPASTIASGWSTSPHKVNLVSCPLNVFTKTCTLKICNR